MTPLTVLSLLYLSTCIYIILYLYYI